MSEKTIETIRAEHDPVDRPAHYRSHPSGIECIRVTENLDFCTGNAFKYVFRASEKNGEEDFRKAIWYLENEIKMLEDAYNPRMFRTMETIILIKRIADAEKSNLNMGELFRLIGFVPVSKHPVKDLYEAIRCINHELAKIELWKK